MSDYQTLESSQQDSRPLEIYDVVRGSNSWYYTSDAAVITFDGTDYQPIGISREKVSDDGKSLSVKVPPNIPAVLDFLGDAPPSESTTVLVRRLQRDEVPTFNTQVQEFFGMMRTPKFVDNGERASMELRSKEADSRIVIPQETFASGCPLALYGTRCGATTVGRTLAGTVTAVDGNTLDLAGVNASGQDFVNGYVTNTSGTPEYRMVLEQSGDTLTLLLPFSSNVLGANLQAVEGCDRIVGGDCDIKHGRVRSFRGWPFVPTRNLFETGIL